MRLSRQASLALAGVLATSTAVAVAPSASATAKPTTPTSLADVLAQDTSGFDYQPHDFDIVTAAVGAVLEAKPESPVAVLADATTPVTAFLPTDISFQLLVNDLTGQWQDEKGTFTTVAGLGIDTVEEVLLYHVVPGATITSKQAVKSNGAKLTTAQGGTIEVKVLSKAGKVVQLKDNDKNDIDPFLNRELLDINKGNPQIAHGIFFVLRPADL
ncbi:MAG: fasciclin domain-containing protein [Actinomycetota bacterium]